VRATLSASWLIDLRKPAFVLNQSKRLIRTGEAMKHLLVFGIALMLLISLAPTVLAAPERVATSNPTLPAKMNRLAFNGTLQSTETSVTAFPTMSATATGSGNATQLGSFTIHYQVEINLLDLSATEAAQFSGTNGDSLRAEAVGQATENRTPGMLNIVDIYRITGGTGRFNGASGTFTLHRLVSVTTGAASSTFEGYILMPWK